MDERISLEQVNDGLIKGIVEITDKIKDACREVVCRIGDNWFYFTSSCDEGLTIEEFLKEYSVNDITAHIYSQLESFRTSGYEGFTDEYRYYYYYLKGKLGNGNQ